MSGKNIARRLRGWLSGLEWMDPRARREVARPGDELRFTRAAQGARWAMAAVLPLCVAGALLYLRAAPWHPDGGAALPWLHPAWVVPPVLAAAACLWVAVYCTSHACLILSPVGIEIFPLLFPGRGLRVVMWQEIRAARVERGGLWLDLDEGRGVVVSLRPLSRPQVALLGHAIEGRLGQSGAMPP